MSFTSEIKSEIARNELKVCCKKAQLCALIQLCSTLTISNKQFHLVIKSENITTIKRIYVLLKDQYQVEQEISVVKKMNLRKNNIYSLKVSTSVKEILEDLTLYSSKGLLEKPMASVVVKECCARSYLAGAFMAMGSCNAPTKSNYHLEIVTQSESHANFIAKLMLRFDLPAKVIVRRLKYVTYLKASDKIGDFLRCIGAFDLLLKFEDIRIQRDFRNSLTRVSNCDLANEMKSIKAANSQMEDIDKIKEHGRYPYLDQKLKDVIDLRLQHPDASLNELCFEYEQLTGIPISKSGMKHRFVKIAEIAEKL